MEHTKNLPPELIAELSSSPDGTKARVERDSANVLAAIESISGEASLDKILIAFYRLHGEVKRRAWMRNKIYRMPEVASVAGRKGVYETRTR